MIRRYRHITQRPDTFRLNPDAQAAQGLVFAGLAPGGLVGGTHYHDSSLYGNHGTLRSACTWNFAPDINRAYVNSPAGSSYVGITINEPTRLSTLQNFTICAWINIPNTDVEVRGVWHKASSVKIGDYSLNVRYSGIRVCINNGYRHIQGNTVIAGQWNHIAATYDGTKIASFINGVSTGTPTSYSTPIAHTGNYCWIANWYNGAYGLIGSVGDVLVYNCALSSAEIQQLADPSNTLLSGLILPPRRMVFPAAAVAGGDKTVSISSPLDVTVALEGFPIAINRTIQITG